MISSDSSKQRLRLGVVAVAQVERAEIAPAVDSQQTLLPQHSLLDPQGLSEELKRAVIVAAAQNRRGKVMQRLGKCRVIFPLAAPPDLDRLAVERFGTIGLAHALAGVGQPGHAHCVLGRILAQKPLANGKGLCSQGQCFGPLALTAELLRLLAHPCGFDEPAPFLRRALNCARAPRAPCARRQPPSGSRPAAAT